MRHYFVNYGVTYQSSKNSHAHIEMLVTDKWSSSTLALRRRSTHHYQSILVEKEDNNGDDYDLVGSNDNGMQNVILTPPPTPPQLSSRGWKVFVLTTSVTVTNYFCCNVNLSRVRSFSPMQWVYGKLGGEEIAGIKRKLASSVVDWLLDLGTSVNHLSNNNFTVAISTCLIVLVSGMVTTVGFLRDGEIRATLGKIAAEEGRIWKGLLYTPTFFSIVSIKLWLSKTIEYNQLIKEEGMAANAELEADIQKLKDWSLKALWLETISEAKPQSLLQTLFLLEDWSYNSLWDVLPILLSLWSMHSVTGTIYDLIILNFTDQTTLFSKLYGNTYTVLSVLSPVLAISSARIFFGVSNTSNVGNNGALMAIAVTGIALLLYYLLFEIIYETVFFLCKLFCKKENVPSCFVIVYSIVVYIIFCTCISLWMVMVRLRDVNVRYSIVISIFLLSLVINLISCIKAFDFTVETFRLKNVKIDAAWRRLQTCRGKVEPPSTSTYL